MLTVQKRPIDYYIWIVMAFLSIVCYGFFAYCVERANSLELIATYSLLFILFYGIVNYSKWSVKQLLLLAFMSRIVFLLAIPNLSQDFYRFIWDGRMLLKGINPYLFAPDTWILTNEQVIAQGNELIQGMGTLNASHYSNYPPVNQLCFVIANLFSSQNILGSVIGMRVIIILADLGTFYFGSKLLKTLGFNSKRIFWYILNPFIIIELTGNLHFEGVMIFFFVWALYLLQKGKWQLAAIIFALSVSVKLIPLIFLPLFFKKLGFKKSVAFYSIVGVTTALLFAPFISRSFLFNYSETIGLWFQKFEFNASFYYLFREIGYLFRGWNEIAIIGKITPILVFLFVLYRSFKYKNKTLQSLSVSMLFVLSFYYFTTTTVHPWYLTTLLLLSLFTRYKFPLIWTFVIILSYMAYSQTDFKENMWIIGLEYAIVYGFLIWELSKRPTGLKTSTQKLA